MSYFILLALDEPPRRLPYVIDITENVPPCPEKQEGLYQFECAEIPENCGIGSDAIQAEWNEWYFQDPDFRPILEDFIMKLIDFDEDNFRLTYELNSCAIEELEITLKHVIESAKPKRLLRICLEAREQIKERMDKTRLENSTLFALLGSDENKGNKTLLTITRYEIQAAIALVQEVSDTYGDKGLDLLKKYFYEGKAFNNHTNYLIWPPASEFKPGLKIVKAGK